MKKVLIALDYGISAQQIAEEGFELAKSMNAKVTLLHVVAEYSYYNTIDSAPFIGFYGADFFDVTETNDNLLTSSLNFLQNIKDRLKDPNIEIMAEHGEADSVILDAAVNHKFDILVIGSHSHNWLEKAIMGSVTESVLKGTVIPMYVIPVKEGK